jgi:hypothetical protein
MCWLPAMISTGIEPTQRGAILVEGGGLLAAGLVVVDVLQPGEEPPKAA